MKYCVSIPLISFYNNFKKKRSEEKKKNRHSSLHTYVHNVNYTQRMQHPKSPKSSNHPKFRTVFTFEKTKYFSLRTLNKCFCFARNVIKKQFDREAHQPTTMIRSFFDYVEELWNFIKILRLTWLMLISLSLSVQYNFYPVDFNVHIKCIYNIGHVLRWLFDRFWVIHTHSMDLLVSDDEIIRKKKWFQINLKKNA